MNVLNRAHARSFAVLLATLGLFASVAQGAPVTLSNGIPVTGISGTTGSEKFYIIEVPAGQDELEIATSAGTGDVDLYVRRGSVPTTTSYDYRPYQVGNNETVTVENPAAGTWYIMLRGYAAYAGVTLEASYSAAMAITPLANSVPVTGLAGVGGNELYFTIEVPAGQTKLEIAMSGGTGDADMYVKKGAMPTTSSYDFRPFLFGNNETVTVNNPSSGTWYIMVRGYNAFTGITLVASYGGGVGAVLQNGVAVPDLSGSAGGQKIFRIDVPAGQTNLEIKMWGGTGDADLFVKFGSPPTTTDYDYRPYLAGSDETVTVNNPTAGTWYVMIRGFTAYSDVTLRASFGDVFTLEDGVPVPDLSGALNSEKFYKIEVPSGETDLLFRIFGGTGNADMYIRRGAKPTTSTWDYRPLQPGNDESISIGNPQAGTWYVMLKAQKAFDGLTLEADYSFSGTVVLLTNNVPVTDIAGGAGYELLFRIIVPSGQQKLEIRMSGGTGDADMYVKRESIPTISDYDCRPYLIGNDETCTINQPTGGTYFIMIRGYQPFSGITLVATHGGGGEPPEEVITLQNGVPVSNIAGAAGSERFYKIDVPAGQAKLEIVTSGGTGDSDLHVRRGTKPTTTEWDHRPYLVGNNETVTIDNPEAGTYYIMLRGYAAYDGLTLEATYLPVSEEIPTLTNGVPVTDLSGAAGSEMFFKIAVPAGQDFLHIEMSDGSGDADLYVRKGSKPTDTSYDYRPYLVGNNESVEIANPAAATWYVMIRGYQTYSGVTLVATYGIEHVGNLFTTDPNCMALWRFEPGALTLDSVSTNTLTNVGAQVNGASAREGEGFADFEFDQADYMQITDANLAAGFPLKNGSKNKVISACFWMRIESQTGDACLIAKYNWSPQQISFALRMGQERKMFLQIGAMNGTVAQTSPKTGPLSLGRWYHVGVTYDDSSRSYRIRIWDQQTGVNWEDTTGTFSNNISLTPAAFTIGALRQKSTLFDGGMDELVVFDDVLTTNEIDKIRQGTYGKP